MFSNYAQLHSSVDVGFVTPDISLGGICHP